MKESGSRFTDKDRLKLCKAKYALLRRYLRKFHPDIASIVSVEGLTIEQVEEKERKLGCNNGMGSYSKSN